MDITHDLAYAARLVRRNPGFYFLTTLVMAVGIGSLSAIFSVVDGVLLEPLPYGRPDRLVSVQTLHPELGANLATRVTRLKAFRDESHTFDALGAVSRLTLEVETEGRRSQVGAALVSPDFFDLLGVTPRHGRGFVPSDAAGGRWAVVLGHRFWRRHFAAGEDALGTTLHLRGGPGGGEDGAHTEAATVVGVLPEGVTAPFPNFDPQVWIAADFSAAAAGEERAFVFGRLRDGVGRDAAEQELQSIYARLQQQEAGGESPWRIHLVPLREFLVGDVRRPLLLLLAGGVLLLLVAGANTASLLMARANLRTREAALRVTLGARRRRIARQLFAEGLLPALLAGAVGLLAAWAGVRLLRSLPAVGLPRNLEPELNPAVLAVAALLTLGAGVIFAVVPGFRFSMLRLTTVINECRATSLLGIVPRGRTFVSLSFQICFALALSAAAVLLATSLSQLQKIHPGFDTEGLLTARLTLPPDHYPNVQAKTSLYQRLLERVSTLPEVKSCGMVNFLPLSGRSGATEIAAESAAEAALHETAQIELRAVTLGYLEAMGMEPLKGRFFEARDLRPLSVILSEGAARNLWGDRDPLGRRIKLGAADSPNPWAQVVGVVGDVKHDSLTLATRPTLYYPLPFSSDMSLVVRAGTGRPEQLAGALRQALESVDPGLFLTDIETMEERVSSETARTRTSAVLMSLLALVTVVLAAAGTYGVIWQTTVQKRSEIAVRFALGATKGRIYSWVFWKAFPWLLIGVGAGFVCAFSLARQMASLLYGVQSWEPEIFGLTAAAICGMGVVGTFLPARRASRIDPCVLLRI